MQNECNKLIIYFFNRYIYSIHQLKEFWPSGILTLKKSKDWTVAMSPINSFSIKGFRTFGQKMWVKHVFPTKDLDGMTKKSSSIQRWSLNEGNFQSKAWLSSWIHTSSLQATKNHQSWVGSDVVFTFKCFEDEILWHENSYTVNLVRGQFCWKKFAPLEGVKVKDSLEINIRS